MTRLCAEARKRQGYIRRQAFLNGGAPDSAGPVYAEWSRCPTDVGSITEGKQMLEITIKGRPITKKNSSQIVTSKATGRPFLIPSKAYKQYEQDAGWQIKCKDLMIDYPVNVKCLYYMPTRHKVDLCNLLEATCDILVHYGVIADDNSQIVAGHDGSRVLYDKDNPRCEIEITAL